MSEEPEAARDEPIAVPETTTLLLTTFAEFYRQELGAEEDVHRSLPFFGTALGLVIGALAYAAGRLSKWMTLEGLATYNGIHCKCDIPCACGRRGGHGPVLAVSRHHPA